MIVKMKAPPVDALPKTNAKMAKTIAKNVEATAANCGEFPNGAPIKNDQLHSESLDSSSVSMWLQFSAK